MRSQHEFSQVPTQGVPRSSFNLSHSHKTTFDADYLIPICQPIDIIPGDTFSFKTSFFLRLNTMLRPILDNLHFDTFAFFVPYRTIWENHEKFHGSRDDPTDNNDFTIPILGAATTLSPGDLGDYFGLPLNLNTTNQTDISALPFRAYRKIYNEWFRDENLQDSQSQPNDNGPDSTSESGVTDVPLKRGKKKDYFTSCLPWPQKGSAVSMPLGTSAPITGIAFAAAATILGPISGKETDMTGTDADYLKRVESSNLTEVFFEEDPDNLGFPNIRADLTAALAPTINDIRLAFQTQRLLERDARSGTRYVEMLKAHFKVSSPDFRLQRAEFLGGGSSVISLTPVMQQSAQTTPTESDKVGNLAANGTVSGTHSWTKSFVEHGVVIILGNIRGDISYSQGLDRYWTKQTRFDFYYPVLQGIGEQSVLNKEIWLTNTPATDALVFGYQERYAEYRFLNSKLTSLMRPDASGTLASWHLSEDFSTLPALGDTFIQANTGVPLDRAIAVPSQPQFFADFYHQIKAARPLPLYGVPGGIDRF